MSNYRGMKLELLAKFIVYTDSHPYIVTCGHPGSLEPLRHMGLQNWHFFISQFSIDWDVATRMQML